MSNWYIIKLDNTNLDKQHFLIALQKGGDEMSHWISGNIATIIAAVTIAVIFIAAAASKIKARKQGNCCGGCQGCSGGACKCKIYENGGEK